MKLKNHFIKTDNDDDNGAGFDMDESDFIAIFLLIVWVISIFLFLEYIKQ